MLIVPIFLGQYDTMSAKKVSDNTWVLRIYYIITGTAQVKPPRIIHAEHIFIYWYGLWRKNYMTVHLRHIRTIICRHGAYWTLSALSGCGRSHSTFLIRGRTASQRDERLKHSICCRSERTKTERTWCRWSHKTTHHQCCCRVYGILLFYQPSGTLHRIGRRGSQRNNRRCKAWGS